jgi:hypothetical protein
MERYKAITSEDKPVSAWIAELRTRTGTKAPASAEPTAAPDAGSPAATTPSENGGPT